MSTTRYVTATSQGVITLTARAIDPDGNIIDSNIVMYAEPSPIQTVVTATGTTVVTTTLEPPCYSQIILASTPQTTLEQACVQYGTALTYYIGAPRDTIYLTKDCSVIAESGYYKLDDGSWILLNGGRITQRGSCTSVQVTTDTVNTNTISVPKYEYEPVLKTVEPITPVSYGSTQVFIPETTFTPISPTLVPPQPTFEPISTTTTTFEPEPVFTPARTKILGCTDPSALNYNPSATADDGSCQYSSFSGYTTNYEQL